MPPRKHFAKFRASHLIEVLGPALWREKYFDPEANTDGKFLHIAQDDTCRAVNIAIQLLLVCQENSSAHRITDVEIAGDHLVHLEADPELVFGRFLKRKVVEKVTMIHA